MKNKLIFIFSAICILTSFALCSNKTSKEAQINAGIPTTVYITETLIADSVNLVERLDSSLKINSFYKFAETRLKEMFEPKQKYVISDYHISKRGQDFIKSYETLQLEKYHITGERYYTIGWGHQIRPDEHISNKISEKTAQKLFDSDIAKCDASVKRLIGKLDKRFKVTQGFVDAIGSLVFNCGETGTENSEFFQRMLRCRFDKHGNINKGDLKYSLEGIKISHVYLEGHKTRRKGEYELAKL